MRKALCMCSAALHLACILFVHSRTLLLMLLLLQVYRGTWKHTDIAAKEYLPHLPGEQGGQPNSPLSEAAKANAQVRLEGGLCRREA